MKILVLGGAHFLGRHVVEQARHRDHTVTLFNRGQTAPGLFPDVEELHGDRDGGLDALRGRHWDAVIDTSGYVPRIVRQSAELLASFVSRYLFVSSISVYADFHRTHIDETYPVGQVDDKTTEDVGQFYGPLKALCEQVVEAVYGERAVIVRPGLIVGPYDPTDRFTYWVRQFARGSHVLVPGSPDRPVQLIDGRDLASFMIDLLENRDSGVFNATGMRIAQRA